MVMPLAGRVVFAVIGGLLVFTSASSVIGTMIVSRSISSRLTRWVDRAVDWTYQLVVARLAGSPGGGGAARRSPGRRRRTPPRSVPTARPVARHPGGGDLGDPAGGVAHRGLRR